MCEAVHEKCESKKVAFFVGQSNHVGPINPNTDLVLDTEVTNFGSAYSVCSGRFTAPVRAMYQFNVTITAQAGKQVAVEVLKNGCEVINIWVESTPNWKTSSNVAILSLEAGDQIWLRAHRGNPSYVHGQMYTTFNGFLIFEH